MVYYSKTGQNRTIHNIFFKEDNQTDEQGALINEKNEGVS